MRQRTFAENGFERYRKQTRREVFLTGMEEIIPWRERGESYKKVLLYSTLL